MPWPTLALDDWKPVPRSIAIIELVFLALFLLYAALNSGHFLLLDFANLAIHEAGHPLFGIIGGNAEYCFGHTLMVLGGTLLELIVPAACAAYFLRREPTGTACCCFWFFENFLYIASYMGDARTASQPLVGGDESDWTILFTQWHVLTHDTQIASITRTLGWLGIHASFRNLVRPPLLTPPLSLKLAQGSVGPSGNPPPIALAPPRPPSPEKSATGELAHPTKHTAAQVTLVIASDSDRDLQSPAGPFRSWPGQRMPATR